MKNLFKILTVILFTALHSASYGWWTSRPSNYSEVTITSAKRSNIFYVGESVALYPSAPVRYEIRNYYGDVVEQGNSTTQFGFPVILSQITKPGWYKVYLHGTKDLGAPYGDSVGGTTFVIFRNNANFPPLPGKDAPSGCYYDQDMPVRDVTGMGPQRFTVWDITDPDGAIANLEGAIAAEKISYMPYDPARKRALMINFPNGVVDLLGNAWGDNLRKIVDHFKNDVQYWECRNEPNGSVAGAWYATVEQKLFYQTIKSVNPKLQVIGPAVVTIDYGICWWLSDFLNAGGMQYLDAFSFHCYNNTNGDLSLMRSSIGFLRQILADAQVPNKEIWQTEQGSFATCYGAYTPRLQGRWTMMQQMVFEQYGIPKERNVIWYDRSHGFWDFPCWWENDDTSLNPTAPLMRVWSEEVYGLTFQKAFDFGPTANDFYIGDLFTNGSGKSMAAFMTAGIPNGSVQLKISSGSSIHVVSPFGEASDLAVVNGLVTVPVSELPVYVELSNNQRCDVVPAAYGENVALRSGVSVTTNNQGGNLIDGGSDNNPSRLVNGRLENWYWDFSGQSRPWMSNLPVAADGTHVPAIVEVDLPGAETISDVIIHAPVPWQYDGTLLNYDLQYWNGSAWTLLPDGHVSEPTKTINAYTPVTMCTVDQFFSDRYTFVHHFNPVTTSKIRVVINQATSGMGATPDVGAAMYPWGGGMTSCQATLREIAIYKAVAPAPKILVQPASKVVKTGDNATLSVLASTSANAQYTWSKDGQVVQTSTSAVLPITASANTQGLYSVSITDAGGTVVSNPAAVLLSTPLNAWLVKYFPQVKTSDMDALLMSSTDGDGFSNLQKYFFNMAPGAAPALQNLPRPVAEVINGVSYMTLSYVHNAAATDVQVIAEGASDLAAGNWATVQPDLSVDSAADAATGAVTTQLKFRVTNTSAKFFRLRLATTQTWSKTATASRASSSQDSTATQSASASQTASASPKLVSATINKKSRLAKASR